jgi:Tfp pilus assembly protein PilO
MSAIGEDIRACDRQITDSQAALALLEEKLASVRKTKAKQQEKVEQLQAELTDLQTRLGQITPFSLPRVSPFPNPAHLLPQALGEMAGSQELTDIAVGLQEAETFQDQPGIVSRISASGSLEDIRNFLIQLLETPYVASLNQIELTTCKDLICLNLEISVFLG